MDTSNKRKTKETELLILLWDSIRFKYKHGATDLTVPVDVLKMRALSDRFGRFSKSLNRLAGRKLVALQGEGHDRRVVMTTKGLAYLAHRCMVSHKNKNRKKTRVCIISFDVPESFRPARRVLRSFLKDGGFTKVHKSTWVGDEATAEHILFLAQMFRLERYLRVYIGTELKGADSVRSDRIWTHAPEHNL